jgi:F-type H+-transporting ATPase subunit b
VTFLDLLGPTLVYAAAEAEHGAAAHHAPSIGDLTFPLINFLIYVGILWYFALPPVREFLRTRRQQVVDQVQAASAKKQAAEALVREYNGKIAGLDREIQVLDTSMREEGQREKAKIIAEAGALAAKLKDDARFVGEQEVKMARQKLREEMADKAQDQAESLLERNFSSADQTRLVDDFVRSIGQAT